MKKFNVNFDINNLIDLLFLFAYEIGRYIETNFYIYNISFVYSIYSLEIYIYILELNNSNKIKFIIKKKILEFLILLT